MLSHLNVLCPTSGYHCPNGTPASPARGNAQPPQSPLSLPQGIIVPAELQPLRLVAMLSHLNVLCPTSGHHCPSGTPASPARGNAQPPQCPLSLPQGIIVPAELQPLQLVAMLSYLNVLCRTSGSQGIIVPAEL